MQACSITTAQLGEMLQEFLLEHPQSAVIEDGEILFDFSDARYSVSGEGKCLLHLWSGDRNCVRRVLDAEVKGSAVYLSVVRFGQSQPTDMEICAEQERRSAGTRRAVRLRYQAALERMLLREHHGAQLEKLSSNADLGRSFSPIYTRGVLRQGQSAFVVLGVNSEENQSSIDAALTYGLLWMDYQRGQLAGQAHVEGLKLFLPPNQSETVRQRLAHLDHEAAKFELYEFEERSAACAEVEPAEIGNIMTRLARCADTDSAHERFAASIARIRAIAPAAEVVVDSVSEIVFRFYGLEFARAHLLPVPGSFRNVETISFGAAPAEYTLGEQTEPLFRELVARLIQQRHAEGSPGNILYRFCAERWLESLVKHDVRSIDERLDGSFVYSQVPAFAACDRAMLDILTSTADGRLAVLELKADEDINLPLQGLDYWARVRWHQQHGGFLSNGYFAGRELSSAPPLLYLVTPALRTHPTTDTLLRYLSPLVDWIVVQIDERWRQSVRVVNRKRAHGVSLSLAGAMERAAEGQGQPVVRTAGRSRSEG